MQNPFFSALLGRIGAPEGGKEKHTVACMLSFTPYPPLPELKGKMSEVMPGAGGLSMLDRGGIGAREMTVPHQLTLVQPELQKLEGPEVQDGKVMFQFTQIEDANVTVIGGTVGGVKPVTVDHGTIELCQ